MKKITYPLVALILMASAMLLPARNQETATASEGKTIYTSPLPGSKLVNSMTTIAFRPGDAILPGSLSSGLFSVVGTSSGIHAGTALLADDGKTVIFKPDKPFALGEQVQVTINPGLRTLAGQMAEQASFSFTISPKKVTLSPQQTVALSLDSSIAQVSPKAAATGSRLPGYVTLPYDYPTITVTTPASNTAAGYMFLAPTIFRLGPNYMLIFDNSGNPIYYRRFLNYAFDFKKQNNGTLTYYNDGLFHAIDNTYTEIATYAAGNGYNIDLHDLQILPNGHALLLAYDPEPVDMSAIVPGGNPNATVVGLIVQELDTFNNVIFQWRSWDHFLITDTYESLTSSMIDYVHGNAVEEDTDGNLLISSRHMSEVTKINRQTGDIIWRLGGKNNQFTSPNDTPPYFWYQHDIRRLPNGDITLFDNRTGLSPVYSEALEYQLDEVNRIATQVWSYRNTPDAYGFALGNVQRLPNGNSMIQWGFDPLVTEARQNGTKAFEFEIGSPYGNYRAFRFTWQGFPTTQPTLVLARGVVTSTLTYSWNGATEIGSYRVYGGNAPEPATLITTQPKTGFETHTVVPTQSGCYYYRVMPVDIHGADTRYSNELSTCILGTPIFLPVISH